MCEIKVLKKKPKQRKLAHLHGDRHRWTNIIKVAKINVDLNSLLSQSGAPRDKEEEEGKVGREKGKEIDTEKLQREMLTKDIAKLNWLKERERVKEKSNKHKHGYEDRRQRETEKENMTGKQKDTEKEKMRCCDDIIDKVDNRMSFEPPTGEQCKKISNQILSFSSKMKEV